MRFVGPFDTRLSLRNVEQLLEERVGRADHTTLWRWVQRYGPELEQSVRRYLKPTNKSWRVEVPTLRSKPAGVLCIGPSIRRARRSISYCEPFELLMPPDDCFVSR